MPQTAKHTLSVIIPTLNAGERLRDVLDALQRQTALPDEILVIDSGSQDSTLAIAESFGARILSVDRESFDHGGTRSLAGQEAVGKILVYMTQDAVPADPYALENLVSSFQDGRIAAAYGRQLPNSDATVFASHLRQFNYPGRSSIRCFEDREKYGFRTAFISNSFAAYRKSLLERVGFFEQGMLFGEDTFTLVKLLHSGYCVAYSANARVFHSHNYSLNQEFRRYFDIGVVHARHLDLIESFGTPGAEGRNFVVSELSCLVRKKKYLLLPVSIVRSGAKFIAYHLGRRYTMLPRGLARLCSLNRPWWPFN